MVATTEVRDLDLFDDATLADPYPTYRRMRAAAPAVHLRRHDVWAISRYEDVRRALRDYRTFSSVGGLGLVPIADIGRTGVLVSTDPPEHDRVRDVIRSSFSPHALKSLTAQVESQADEIVAGLVERGTFDAVTELSETLPVNVAADLLGLPRVGREHLIEWATALFDLNGPPGPRTPENYRLTGELMAWVDEVIAAAAFPPGSVGAVVSDAVNSGKISEPEGFSIFRGLVIAGMDTTYNGVSTAIHLFATHPEQWERLAPNPASISAAWEEVLRFDAPVQLFFRAVTDDVTLDEVTIPAGSRAAVMYGSANRDERRWRNPDVFDIGEARRDHLAFGHGVHACVGATLARLEAKALLRALAERVGSIEPAGPPERRLNSVARGFARLPVTVHPR